MCLDFRRGSRSPSRTRVRRRDFRWASFTPSFRRFSHPDLRHGSPPGIFSAQQPKTVIIEPDIQPVYLSAGDTLKLTCRQTEGSGMVWTKDDQTISTEKGNLEEHGFVVYTKVEGGQQFSTLQKDKISSNDGAIYGCQPVGRPKNEAWTTEVSVGTSK